jgi:ABC-2 type transport system permease protein
MKIINYLFNSRFLALLKKEKNQLLRNKQLIVLLIFIPSIYLMLVGFSLNDDIKNIPFRYVDYANTKDSRELISTFSQSGVFITKPNILEQANSKQQILSKQVSTADIVFALVIPPDFKRNQNGDETTKVQAIIDGADAATAIIVNAYLNEIINNYIHKLNRNSNSSLIQQEFNIIYNPRLISYWFIVPAVLGLVLTLTSSVAATNSVITEKEAGTLEQLLMTPVSAEEIILAKILPLVIVMIGDIILALGMARLIFGLPIRGNIFLFLALGSLYTFVGIGLGMLIGTFSRTHLQASLSSFFINVPLGLVSGAVTPLESMPPIFQYLSFINPLRYYVEIMRGLLLKGVGLDVLWPNVIALFLFAIFLLTVSTSRFRRNLT